MRFWRVVGLGLALVVASPAVLIPFLNRASYEAGTIESPGVPTTNGIDFTSPAVCPTNGSNPGCATTSISYSNTASGINPPATLLFSSIPGFSIQGFSASGSNGVTRLTLYAVGYDHTTWLPMTYTAPVLSTRNTFDTPIDASALRIRINVPTGVDSFAIDLSNGCNTNTNQNGANNCGPEDNHHGTILVTAKRIGQAIVASDRALVTTVDGSPSGELTFFGARSDGGDLEYIELTLPAFADAPTNSVANTGSIMATRISFGQATPEPATLLLTAAGLALLLRRRLR